MKKIVVTGGSGFIGLHTTRKLLEKGFKVSVIDLVKPEVTHPNLEYIEADIRNKKSCEAAFRGAYAVLHAAAMSRSGPSNPLWKECISTNIQGTANVLEISYKYGVNKFVYCGSSTYYGNQMGPQVESLPPNLLNFYGATKYAGEEICRQFEIAFGMKTVVLRYFNVYGPGQPSTGEYALVMGIFLKAFLKNQPVVINGNGEQIRDFIHVNDVTEANLSALINDSQNLTLNIGSGFGISILDLAKRFDLIYSFGPKRLGDAEVTLADISKAKSHLNWEPKIRLDYGIEELKKVNYTNLA